jgi:molybdate transport system substrate-binding protein
MGRLLALAAFAAMIPMSLSAEEPIRLYAAGSLSSAMADMAHGFEAESGLKIAGTFGASGLLRQRIEAGEQAEVFASADLGHPTALAKAERAAPAVVFTRNRLCALARRGMAVSTDSLLDRMLDPAVRLGTSTPKADPSGDYAWQVFEKADRLRPGAFDKLAGKALQLTGGPNSQPPPPGRSVYGAVLENGQADLFLTYCTGAQQASREVPGLSIVALPEALAVGADYGLTVIHGARPEAWRFAMFILSPAGQSVLAQHGFATVTRPAEP